MVRGGTGTACGLRRRVAVDSDTCAPCAQGVVESLDELIMQSFWGSGAAKRLVAVLLDGVDYLAQDVVAIPT